MYIYTHIPKFISSCLVIHGTSQLIYPQARKIKYIMFKTIGLLKPSHPNPIAQLATSFKTKILLSYQEHNYTYRNCLFFFYKCCYPISDIPQLFRALPDSHQYLQVRQLTLRTSQPLKHFINISCHRNNCIYRYYSSLFVRERTEKTHYSAATAQGCRSRTLLCCFSAVREALPRTLLDRRQTQSVNQKA